MFTDTHSHLYLDNFKDDIELVVSKAIQNNVKKIYLPNIDRDSIDQMIELENKYPDVFSSMIGLHPGSVKENYKEEIDHLNSYIQFHHFVAVGEIGIDLYWDTKFRNEQIEAFEIQTDLAIEMNLPIIIHTREAMDLTIDLIKNRNNQNLTGIFHCFTGDIHQAEEIIKLGFLLGIGGVVTYKKSTLPEIVQKIDLKHIVLETDSPFLPPTPYRGKRNESSYIPLIAEKISEIKGINIKEVETITTENALYIFKDDSRVR